MFGAKRFKKMNVLFLTLVEINSIEDRGIYQDLLREFRNKGHNVTIVTPVERRKKIKTNLRKNDNVNILQVKTFNIKKTNVLEKGIGTLAIEYQYLSAIKKHFSETKFDLVLYSTPPITFSKVIEYIKNKDKALSYLLLKDIFPQNAIDMKMLKENGFLHKIFIKKEKKLYRISDFIGCMSQANVEFLLRNNPELDPGKVEVNPNSIEPVEIKYSEEENIEIRKKYSLPLNKKIFVYGGNLGKPQGLDFLIETIAQCNHPNAFFLVVGDGTEFSRLKNWFDINNPSNAMLLQRLPKDDYIKMLAACDVGLIFLDKNFSIPNFPSRLLSYLEMRKPVITATDKNTDIGDIVQEAGCGYKVLSGDSQTMQERIHALAEKESLADKGDRAWELLQKEYLVHRSYGIIANKIIH